MWEVDSMTAVFTDRVCRQPRDELLDAAPAGSTP